jgi:heme/copper-type cytochrome/quinol oxidase subunit 2
VPAGMMNGVVTGQAAPPATAAAPAAPARMLSVTVAGGNKKGPDGKLHDSFSQTEYAVKVGRPTRLRIDNRDDAPHTITSAGAGVNIVVAPGVHMYTMVATAAGRFEWHCALPCDGGPNGWAMSHSGYMAGHITAS